ncbi:hypothetical protein L9F63_016741, partial [Diploptera punctata]
EMGGICCTQSGQYDVNPGPTSGPWYSKLCPTKDYTTPEKSQPGAADRERRGVITTSWRKFVGNAYENSINVFMLFLQEHPEFKEDFKVADKSDSEVRSDIEVKKYTVVMIDFIKRIVDNVDNPRKLDSILSDIRQYYNKIQGYKDAMIHFMEQNELITEKGANIWHGFLDPVMDKLQKKLE